MNKSTISEAFGQQLASITDGTRYEVKTDSETFISELEHRIRRVMYSLWMDAQANRLANSIERRMAAHFQELYEFSYGVTLYDTMEHSAPRKTDTLALMIIDEKESYKKRIEHTRQQYSRFKEICNQLSESDKELITSYFEHSHKVEYEILRECMKRNLSLLENIYHEVDEEKERAAIKEMKGCTADEAREYQEGKQQYIINGQLKYMTEEEYAKHELEQRDSYYERLGLDI